MVVEPVPADADAAGVAAVISVAPTAGVGADAVVAFLANVAPAAAVVSAVVAVLGVFGAAASIGDAEFVVEEPVGSQLEFELEPGEQKLAIGG